MVLFGGSGVTSGCIGGIGSVSVGSVVAGIIGSLGVAPAGVEVSGFAGTASLGFGAELSGTVGTSIG